MDIQLPKGTFDILPYTPAEPWQQSDLWHFLEETAIAIANDYGYQEIRTPIYERTELFNRGVGETTDIVSKEMFTFEDKGGRSLSLRPEGTASVIRSFIEHSLPQARSSHKLYYMGPMFRYERPQSGRYRQFHQFGVEAIGIEDPAIDAETIDMLYRLYKKLGIRSLKVHVNTVGDLPSRALYREALLNYFRPHLKEMSADSQVRFEKNPLRILDSKDPKDKVLVQSAPSILSHLTPDAETHFQKVCHLLDLIQVPYEVNDRIVRGLDYYTKTVFEVTSDELGAQNTLGGGGRYDGLLKSLGGPDLPGIGFATGLERILQVMIGQNVQPKAKKGPLIYFIPLGDEAKEACFKLAAACRSEGIASEIELQAKKVQTGLQNGTKSGAVYCAIIGEHELQSGSLQLKHLETRQSSEISLDGLLSYLRGIKP